MRGEHCFRFGIVLTIFAVAHVCQSFSYHRDYPRRKLESDISLESSMELNGRDYQSNYDSNYGGLGESALYQRLTDAEAFQGDGKSKRGIICFNSDQCGDGHYCNENKCMHRCRNRRRDQDNNILRVEDQQDKDYYYNWKIKSAKRHKRQTCYRDSQCSSRVCSCQNRCSK